VQRDRRAQVVRQDRQEALALAEALVRQEVQEG
jgi:hypothetical protein